MDNEKVNWTIQINDSYCIWEFVINGRDNVCISQIINMLTTYLDGEEISAYKVNNSKIHNKLERIRKILEE